MEDICNDNNNDNIVSISNMKIGDNSTFVFKFKKGSITYKGFNEFLGLLEKLMDRCKPFSFIIDSSETIIGLADGLKTGKFLISWMKKNKPRVPGLILCSSVVLSSTYPKIGDLLNWVFQKQKPVSPNLITTDMDKAKLFITQFYENQ